MDDNDDKKESDENASALKDVEKTEPDNSGINGAPGFGAVGLPDSIVDSLTGDLPEVQRHVVDAGAPPGSESDASPDGFDPAVHAVDSDGNPKRKANGDYQKKRGRKAGSGKATPIKGVKVEPSAEEQKSKATAAMLGASAAGAVFQIGIALGGDEWRPQVNPDVGLNEAENLQQAFYEYFMATGKTDLPPAMALTICISGYALPRLSMPKTQSRLGKLRDWIVLKFVTFRARKTVDKTDSDK